jgi:hypothetical protein
MSSPQATRPGRGAGFLLGAVSLLNGVIALACLVLVKWAAAQFDGTEDAAHWVLGFSAGIAHLCGLLFAALGLLFGVLALLPPDRQRAYAFAFPGLAMSAITFASLQIP